jgi:hypothetical protein
MTVEKRGLYSSPNGDRWFLAWDRATDDVFVRHEPNVPSGGRPSDIEIGTFLSQGQRNPEHQALLRLIGKLIEGHRERYGDLRRAVERVAVAIHQQLPRKAGRLVD